MARLIYTDSSNQERSVYLGPDQPVVKIGRASDCSIRTSRQSVSRRHAEFRYVDGTFEVTDLNSSNGTWLIEDEQRFEISHERLEDGDEIWCGDFIVHFSLTDAPAEDLTGGASFGRTSGQYVSGPTEAASASAFGAQPASGHPSGPSPAVGQVDPSGEHFEYAGIDELSAVEVAEAKSLPPAAVAAHREELEQLREQKQSLEDLASRQTFEITDLQAQLQQANERLAAQADAAESLEALRAELAAAQQHNTQLKRQLAEAAPASDELDQMQADLDAMQAKLNAEAERADALQADKTRADSEIRTRDAQIDRLEETVQELRDQLQDAAGDDADALRQELERSNRLLTEYERRNADLRIEFDAQRDANAALRQAAGELRAELAEAREALEAAEARLSVAEPARQELSEAQKALEDAEIKVEDLKAEVQGLKQRVQLERRRNKEADPEATEALRAERDQARAQVDALQAQLEALQEEFAAGETSAPQPADGGLGTEVVEALRERLETLDRLTDAIVRADLEPLSTVDRIRLQSAIRETDPKQTLHDALQMLDGPA